MKTIELSDLACVTGAYGAFAKYYTPQVPAAGYGNYRHGVSTGAPSIGFAVPSSPVPFTNGHSGLPF
jgi:hypothetical protein